MKDEDSCNKKSKILTTITNIIVVSLISTILSASQGSGMTPRLTVYPTTEICLDGLNKPQKHTKNHKRPSVQIERIPQRVVYPSIASVEGSPVLSDIVITSPFGVRLHPIKKRMKHHDGVDIAGKKGDPVYATFSGVVKTSERERGYGNVIRISSIVDSVHCETLYAHLSKRIVEVGDTIKVGTLIGKVGSTGQTTGPHLHYEVRMNGVLVNPEKYIRH